MVFVAEKVWILQPWWFLPGPPGFAKRIEYIYIYIYIYILIWLQMLPTAYFNLRQDDKVKKMEIQNKNGYGTTLGRPFWAFRVPTKIL